MPVEAGVICWDIQGTLCDFRSGKPGISTLLGELSREGFQHFAVTGADREDGAHALARMGLQGYFSGVLGREDHRARMSEKPYSVVAGIVGLSSEEAKAKMLVIGDSPSDQPTMKDVVFIHHAGGVIVDSLFTRDIIHTLQERGEGNFYAGFRRLEELTGSRRLMILPSGVAFIQQWWNVNNKPEQDPLKQLTPVITQIGIMPRPLES